MLAFEIETKSAKRLFPNPVNFIKGGIKYALIPVLILVNVYFVQAQNFFLREDSLLTLLKTQYASLSTGRILIAAEIMSHRLPDEPLFDSGIGR